MREVEVADDLFTGLLLLCLIGLIVVATAGALQ